VFWPEDGLLPLLVALDRAPGEPVSVPASRLRGMEYSMWAPFFLFGLRDLDFFPRTLIGVTSLMVVAIACRESADGRNYKRNAGYG